MTLSKPPALATWMLNHLTLGSDRDALAGDLLEEFGLRRSVGWYWRQVLMAILVGFSKEVVRQWRAAVFALAWTVALVTAVPVLYHNTQFHLVFRWALSHDWPESGILTMSVEIFPQFLMWWFGLGLYLLLMRSFTARRFARGVLINVFMGFLAFASYLSIWPIVLRISMQRGLPFPFIYWTPYFLALLLSLCATLPSTEMKRTARIHISSQHERIPILEKSSKYRRIRVVKSSRPGGRDVARVSNVQKMRDR